MIRTPGVWALAKSRGGRRTVVALGVGASVGPDAMTSPEWRRAIRFGAGEFLFTVGIRDFRDLEKLRTRLTDQVSPIIQPGQEARVAA